MLRITLWRVFKLVVALVWCLSVVLSIVWLALPFPSVSVEERATYIQNTLAAGKPVVAAWDVEPFQRTDQRALDADWCSDCTSVLFHWQFARLYNKVQILLAPHESYYRDRPFELAGHFNFARVWNERATGRNNTWSPYFADLWSASTMVPAGREDEHISQGWFHEVDRHLIQHTFHKWTTDVDIRAVIPGPGVVEFWRGVAIDRAFDHASDSWADPLNKNDILQDHTRTPVVYEQMRLDEHDIDLVASFEATENADIKDIVVRELKGYLPSRTWPIRQKLILQFPCFIVGPVMLFKAADDFLASRFAGSLVTLFVVLPIYIGVVCCNWVSAGCPNVFTWVSRFWMTRFLIPKRWQKAPKTQRFWGPSGPMKSDLDKRKLEEKKEAEMP
ncbi:hypothetical protein BU25DRAFT_411125 [Macroventuria anomochaeta]|uniref:Uncharacterized protein n=1 Tax=Macroventuria anomochaeta TaxID=301207 RepID=A0ACB6RZ71_9PLEO|nr:uncharacterized protein BU25DRAFT_411125 [Macroventuria anomochaeta]KAF2627017.1 hypothetical protein BU25DRAFT_411125 [Macroventuria anomochaeta]